MTYDVLTPPPGYGPATHQPSRADRMPGIGAAAAVLGFVEAGFGLALIAYVLVTLASFGGTGDDTASAVVVLIGTIVLSGLMLLGSLFLVRRSGRRLLIGATIAEVVLLFGLGVWALVESSSVYTTYEDYDYGYASSSGSGTAVVVALLAVLLVALALPVVRLALVAQRVVGTWLQGRPPVAPVWSPETQQWVPAPRGGGGTVVALMAPVALMLVATIVVLATAEQQVDYGIADDSPAGVYGTDPDWSYLYDGGDPRGAAHQRRSGVRGAVRRRRPGLLRRRPRCMRRPVLRDPRRQPVRVAGQHLRRPGGAGDLRRLRVSGHGSRARLIGRFPAELDLDGGTPAGLAATPSTRRRCR
jgi:hypothetical protein